MASGQTGLVLARQVWTEVQQPLDRALGLFESLDGLPETSFFRATRASRTAELDLALDGLVAILRNGPAVNLRGAYNAARADLARGEERCAALRERLLTAPPQASLSFLQSWTTETREEVASSLEAERARIEALRATLVQYRGAFVVELRALGLNVSDGQVDALIEPVSDDDFVAMAAVLTAIGHVAEQLRELTDASVEAPEATRRYYGFQVLLLAAVRRMHLNYIAEIDGRILPRLEAFAEDANRLMQQSRKVMHRGGDETVLRANLEANQTAIEAGRLLRQALREQRDEVAKKNAVVEVMLATATNTYLTVRLATDMSVLVRTCLNGITALRSMRLPELRVFQNAEMIREYRRLRGFLRPT